VKSNVPMRPVDELKDKQCLTACADGRQPERVRESKGLAMKAVDARRVCVSERNAIN